MCFTLGFWTPELHSEKLESNYWRLMFALPAIVAIIQLLLIRFGGFDHESVVFAVLDRQSNVRIVLGKIYLEGPDVVEKVIEYVRETN